jgi:hypothetical protein
MSFEKKTNIKANIIFSCIAIALAILATGSAAGPINTTLSFRTSDIISNLIIQLNSATFGGSIYEYVAKTVNNSIPFNWVLAYFFNKGWDAENIHIIIYFLNTFLKIYAYMFIGRALTGRISGGLIAAFLIIFSIEGTLIPYRITASSIASTLGMISLGYCLYGRFRLAAAIAGITVCIHPTFGIFLMLAVTMSFALINSIIQHKTIDEIIKSSIALFLSFILMSMPFILLSADVLVNKVSTVMQNEAAWWGFVPTINNLAFPLDRGIWNLLSYWLLFLLTGLLAFRTAPRDIRSVVIVAIMCVAISGHLLQLIFTIGIKSELLTSFAFNHRANAIARPFLYMTILFVLSTKLKKLNWEWLFWVSLILTHFLYNDWNIFKVAELPQRIKGFPSANTIQADSILLLFISLLTTVPSRIRKKYYATSLTVMLILSLGYIYNNLNFLVFILPLCFLRENIGGFKFIFGKLNVFNRSAIPRRFTHRFNQILSFVPEKISAHAATSVDWCNRRISSLPPRDSTLFVLSLSLGAALFFRVPHEDALINWERFHSQKMLINWTKHFLDSHIPESDHVILMPIRGPGVWLSPTPWRRAYLDSSEGHFLLYHPSFIDEYLRRLAPYAGDNGKTWYLDPKNWTKGTAVRTRIEAIQQIDDKARWVLTFDKFLCGNDRVHAVYDGYGSGPPGHLGKVVLVKARDLDPNCEP